jgi:carbamoyltransferase
LPRKNTPHRQTGYVVSLSVHARSWHRRSPTPTDSILFHIFGSATRRVTAENSGRIRRVRPRPRSPLLNVLGISTGYHDSSCCLLQNGVLTAAAQEERFSRIKNDKAFPRRALRYCLEQARLTLSDIDCVAYNDDPVLKLGRQVWMGLLPNVPPDRRRAVLDRVLAQKPGEILSRLFGYDGPLEFVEHHLSHAASSYYFSGFDEAALLTVDGVGEWATTSYGSAGCGIIHTFEEVAFPHSLGFFYSAITGYLGFEVNEGEYKVMGLAPYGEPIYADAIRLLIQDSPSGQYRLDMRYFGFLERDSMYTDHLATLLGQPPRVPESEITTFHRDVARSVQVVLEDVLVEKVRYLHSRVPVPNLCMAGGVALNVVANSRCLRDSPFEHIFIPPAPGDAGGSLGAAAVAHQRISGRAVPAERLRHAYLGPSTSSAEAYVILKESAARFDDFRGRDAALIRCVADLLVQGKVVGWCQGRMEFGPRALGSRSILADPRRPEMRDRINAIVKMREAFRPFAPAVLASKAPEHFDLDHPSPFMLEVCQVRSPLTLPAVTHVDGSARVQTVDPDTNPRFAALLDAFDGRTGCPILLNTSFNLRGEPIVCTALDAILCFVRSGIDVLAVEDFILERSGIPPTWEVQARIAPARAGSDSPRNFYTML